MEVDLPRRTSRITEHYKKDELDIATQFSNELRKEMKSYLNAVILFGSSARKNAMPSSDIDVLVVINDLSIVVTRDVADAYRIVIQRIIQKVSRRLHVVTLRLSSFWDYMRNGDPIAINMLREDFQRKEENSTLY